MEGGAFEEEVYIFSQRFSQIHLEDAQIEIRFLRRHFHKQIKIALRTLSAGCIGAEHAGVYDLVRPQDRKYSVDGLFRNHAVNTSQQIIHSTMLIFKEATGVRLKRPRLRKFSLPS